ncbi:hypothetical protein M0813_23756 [Anaeramoeba flamelloides]|uniref:Uncharacterized protein n=1 Tax=Anaeramoeba flamelloides TaxID=1746091 RepID=A0ABQ8Y944_9EUKA|nr:hypothetical protein M0813_23756 [Anaeramoeba flamelloides]
MGIQYQLKSPKLGAFLIFLVSHIVGLAMLAIFNYAGGHDFFHLYYLTILGYYVFCSIVLAHYYPTEKTPNYYGLFRHVIAIILGTQFYFLNQEIFLKWFNVPEKYTLPGHFTWIVFGFWFGAFEDTFFKGKITSFLKKRAFAPLFWILVIWVCWIITFYAYCGGHGDYNNLRLQRTLAILQWIIMLTLSTGIHFGGYIGTSKKHWFVLGLITLSQAVAVGTVLAFIWYGMFVLAWPNLDRATLWHHVLYAGTCPLQPIIILGIFTNNFKNTFPETSFKLALFRGALINILTVVVYFFYHGIVSFINTMSESGKPFYKQEALIYNFTIAILQLTWHWFPGKLWMVKPVEIKETESKKEKDQEDEEEKGNLMSSQDDIDLNEINQDSDDDEEKKEESEN